MSPLLFLLIAFAIALSFWIVPVLVAPDKSPDALVMFRQAGDTDYLPLVTAAADLKFGETSVKEYAGTGVRSFPYVPIVIHAVFYRFAGSIGFILADITIVVLYAFLLRSYLHISGVHITLAGVLSLAVISGAAFWIVRRAGEIVHRRVRVGFWEFRFPRPSVTEVVFVLFLILATMLVARPARSAGFFAFFGISLAAIVQSNIYEAFSAGFIAGAVSIIALFSSRDRWEATRRLSAITVAFGVSIVPFVYQQLHVSSDVKRRWGVFSTSQYGALLPDHGTMVWAAVVIAAAVAMATLYRRIDLKRGRVAALGVAATAVGASVASGPASLAMAHQTIQIYHFQDQTEMTIGYALLLCAGLLATDLIEAFKARRLAEKPWSTMAMAATAVCVAGCLVTAYRNSERLSASNTPTNLPMGLLNLAHYRTDFQDLDKVIRSPKFAGASVLATMDSQLADWWEYRHGYLYLPDLFNTTVPDSVVESRIFQFLRMLGTSTEEFGHLLDSYYFRLRVLSDSKYMANSLFTPWPLSDYSQDAQGWIASTKGAWSLIIPKSERARLLAAYDQTSESRQRSNALALIVLDKDPLRGYVHPERSGLFDLMWSNDTFELWIPNNRATSNFPAVAKR